MNIKHGIISLFCILSGLGLVAMPIAPELPPSQIDILGLEGSDGFGETVIVLPNGNIVVCDPYYDVGGVANIGAVYMYDGASAELISILTGSTAGDRVGSGGVTVLSNGNYVVRSNYWGNGEATEVGAVTWGDGTSGITGEVSADNSLVGSTAGDQVGVGGVTALSNGNYVVRSHLWNNNTGAVTWGDGTSGITGIVSVDNSMVGSAAGDQVGVGGVTALSNGNYVVNGNLWNESAGAVTWGDGVSGTTGEVSAANSLVGSAAGDQVGIDGVTALSNGNYVVHSILWNNSTGAVTWGDGTSGITGEVSDTNSLVGSLAGDYVGGGGVIKLSNGNYVVRSYLWNNSTGAVTWGDGISGITGEVSDTNSLVGSMPYDRVGNGGVCALSNGNYVVRSILWNESAGAVTWGEGVSGITGVVSDTNSLVGSEADDQVGQGGVFELSNGNYLVRSDFWNNTAGAVTWGDGMSGITGVVSAANSLIGSVAGDKVGSGGVHVLSNGNYVVRSNYWGNGDATEVGAVTWGDGMSGITGIVSADNSLVGSAAGDQVGVGGVTALSNGNYVVRSILWNESAGAVTWGDGTSGITGEVSADNSLVGSTADAYVGWGGVYALSNGNYVVRSYLWNNSTGAVTWGDGVSGTTGEVSAANSLVGSAADDQVGNGGVYALSNGNYVVSSTEWDNEVAAGAGAVTWGNGMVGTTGEVSVTNSLVGSFTGDTISSSGVTVLSNGNYVVSSPYWDTNGMEEVGAVTWGDGTSGITGEVSDTNSLVGSTGDDRVGFGGVTALSNGNYVVYSPWWDNGEAKYAGAVSWGDGTPLSNGPLDVDNSVRGTTELGGEYLNFAYDDVNMQLVVGRPYDNIVTLFRPNRIPVADAGPDQSVSNNASVTLDGSASYDPDGDLPLAFNWEQSGGIPISLSGSDTANPTFTAPTVEETSTLTFTLVVSDALGLKSLPDEVVITFGIYTALLPLVLK